MRSGEGHLGTTTWMCQLRLVMFIRRFDQKRYCACVLVRGHLGDTTRALPTLGISFGGA